MKIQRFVPASCAVALLAGFTLAFPGRASAQTAGSGKGTLVEEIIARVNNEIVTLSEYQQELAKLPREAQDNCNCSGEQLQAAIQDAQKNLLRDMIDNRLLIERAKDMNIDVETDVIKRLDEVRKQNNLGTLDDLQKAVEESGISWEDYKTQIRDQLLTSQVVQREVGGRMDIGTAEVKAYYEAHKAEFNRPEEVVLSSIVLNTENKTGADIDAVRKRAEDIRGRIEAGESFADLAKRYSEDQATAAGGGSLGTYTRGQLAQQIEDAVFKLDRGQMTDVIQTKTGFMILHVDEHYQAGQQPLEAVQNEIQQRIYMDRIEPDLRKYWAQLREESYVWVKPGYTDSAAVAGATAIQEVAPTADAPDKKAKKKLPLPKVGG